MARVAFPASQDEEHKSLSQLLRELTERDVEVLFIDEIVDHFGRRGFGALLFMFSIPSILPIPGISTVFGTPLLVISAQLLIGIPNLWLPKAIGRRTLRRRDLARIFEQILPRLARVERLLAPRLGWVFGALGDRLIGLVCTLLAAILILPILGANMVPALWVAALGLGLIQRDGMIVLIVYAMVAATATALGLSFKVVIGAIEQMIEHPFRLPFL